MESEIKKKYSVNQPASVHSYTKLTKSESPRTHSSPTSILRKFPHSLRYDQKHQTKIKRNSTPVTMVTSGDNTNKKEKKLDRTVKSWCVGDISTETDETASKSYKCKSVSEEICDNDEDANDNFPEVWELQSTSVNNKNLNSVHELCKENANSSRKDVVLNLNEVKSTSSETQHQIDDINLGSIKKLSVINNSLSVSKDLSDEGDSSNIDNIPEFNNKILPNVHKSTPNLLRSDTFGIFSSLSQPERITDRSSGRFNGKLTLRDVNNHNVPLKGSDSLPQLNAKYKIIHSILPKINRTISESHESLNSPKKTNLAKALIRSETQINSDSFFNKIKSDSYQLLSDTRTRNNHHDDPIRSKIFEIGKRNEISRSDDESERISLINSHHNIVIQSSREREELKSRYRRAIDIMPSLKNLMRRNRGGGNGDEITPPGATVPLMTPSSPISGSCSSLNIPAIRHFDDDDGLTIKKCETVYALTNLLRTDSTLQVEPIKPINRLRVPPNGFSHGSMSRMCSRCSSLLSMASSSRYSINTTGSGFVACSPSSDSKTPEPIMLCKLCLMEVPLSQSMEINQCGCVFCRDCMRLYVEFEIQEGAYDISCPDAQCNKQGIVTISEVETLVATQMMERYLRFRLNHEVDMDRNRTWCPRAGCETVCNICPREKCSPTSVHCPTCDSDFCSNCKNPWHKSLTCEENSKKLAKEGRLDFMEPGIPFDSDLIKCCPMCNVPIEKDEGCAQMMCKRCKHVFCWYCLASLDDDFLLRHYDKGPCKNKLGHSRASVIWHRTQVIGIFAGFGILLLVASPLLLLAAPCIVCCKCRVCSGTKLDADDDLPEESGT